MKRFDEIPPAEKDDFPNEGIEKKDLLIDRLINEGHKPIAVDRAIAIVTQCEEHDNFPQGWCQDPLKVSIFADPDVTGKEEPDEIFIHCGRLGFMGAFLRTNWSDGRFSDQRLAVMRENVVTQHILLGSREAGKELQGLFNEYVTGNYSVVDKATQTVERKHDAKLEELANNAHQMLKDYLAYLDTLPNVF